ncbi:MAG: bifunctional folylpolyglutamate synthase/dihydrofolate synthase [Bacteroidales bacterium]|jgi:dihydrofolate synthase/folylpolyglutamate synthase|nr:bifunctional folylpolyglutamate synthase/dihydrofolate synthase [Bacteroidales bacterium]
MTYWECIEYLYSSLPVYQRIGAAAYKANLNNTLALMEHLNNPEKNFRSIHVAGTNGKGSVSHNLASIYQEAGYKTGLYTSPHLKDFRERIRINGKKISKKFIIDFTEKNKTFFEEIHPSFFEMTVAMAFLYFAQEQVDMAIVETGMGGRLDSTNVITPQLSIITNISYDHTQFLGNTLEDIAREKGGIIKKNIPVIIGETLPETETVFRQIATEKETPIIFADQLFQIQKKKTFLKRDGFWMYFNAKLNNDKRHKKFLTPLVGKYQLNNFKTILAACQTTGKKELPEKYIKDGIRNCVINTGLMGRWQVLHQSPLCIADTGHNPAGIKFVVEQISQTPHKKLHFVLSMVEDKDIKQTLHLLPQNATYYFCKANIPRGLDAHLLKETALSFHLQGKVYSSVKRAYAAAKRTAEKDDLVILGGSNFTVAEVV